MGLRGITPAMERMLIDEVRYLHGLWKIGPPRSNSTTNNYALPVTVSTAFKREHRRKRRRRRQKQKEHEHEQEDQTASSTKVPPSSEFEIVWSCPPSSESPPDEIRTWGDVGTIEQTSKPLSAEEIEKITALRMQKDCLKICGDFLSKHCSSDDDGDFMREEEEGEGIQGNEEDRESGAGLGSNFKFLMGVFENNAELRGYYEKNWGKGEFVCLVCGGIGEKLGRRFKDCVSLIQHSNSVTIKTKNKLAHRAFADVVCGVLRFNKNRLPSIPRNTLVGAAPADTILQHRENAAVDTTLQSQEAPSSIEADDQVAIVEADDQVAIER